MKRTFKVLAAIAPLFFATPVLAQPANAPVVAVLVFDNNSFGRDAKDFDGIGRTITELLIVDMASSRKVRVVERERLNKVLEELNLAKSGAIDPQTAIRVGKLLNACYSVFGGFTRDNKGENHLTMRSTNNETSQVLPNAQKTSAKGDNVMEMVEKASTQFIREMDYTACPGTAGTSAPGTGPQPTPQGSTQQGTTQVAKDAPIPAPAGVELWAKPLAEKEVAAFRAVKLDARSTVLYSRALDAADAKDTARAVSLLKQVVSKYPDFKLASDKLASLQKSGD